MLPYLGKRGEIVIVNLRKDVTFLGKRGNCYNEGK